MSLIFAWYDLWSGAFWDRAQAEMLDAIETTAVKKQETTMTDASIPTLITSKGAGGNEIQSPGNGLEAMLADERKDWRADLHKRAELRDLERRTINLDAERPAAPVPPADGAGERRYCPNGLEHGSCLHPDCVSSCPGRLAAELPADLTRRAT